MSVVSFRNGDDVIFFGMLTVALAW